MDPHGQGSVVRGWYNTPWPMYAVGATRSGFASSHRIAVATSYNKPSEVDNQIMVLEKPRDADAAENSELSEVATTQPIAGGQKEEEARKELDPFPITKIMWAPEKDNVFMTSSTCLNMYRINEDNEISYVNPLNTSLRTPKTTPLTAFDWPEKDPGKVGASAVDTTCTIWDIEKGKIETQLIAHDSQVNDISFFESSPNCFATVGMDGSMRTFDKRQLEHSTILLETKTDPETKKPVPFVRVQYRPDKNQLAALALNEPIVYLVDLRRYDKPSHLVAPSTFSWHCGAVPNSVVFTPSRKDHILTSSSDGCVNLWDTASICAERGVKSGERTDLKGKKPAWSYDCGTPELFHASWPDPDENLLLLGHEGGVQVVHCDYPPS